MNLTDAIINISLVADYLFFYEDGLMEMNQEPTSAVDGGKLVVTMLYPGIWVAAVVLFVDAVSLFVEHHKRASIHPEEEEVESDGGLTTDRRADGTVKVKQSNESNPWTMWASSASKYVDRYNQ